MWLGTSIALAAGTVILLGTWFAERRHGWANNWLPNLVAEWSGILLAVLIVDHLRESSREVAEEARKQLERDEVGWEVYDGLKRTVLPLLLLFREPHGDVQERSSTFEELIECYPWKLTPNWVAVVPYHPLLRAADDFWVTTRATYSSFFTVAELRALTEVAGQCGTLATTLSRLDEVGRSRRKFATARRKRRTAQLVDRLEAQAIGLREHLALIFGIYERLRGKTAEPPFLGEHGTSRERLRESARKMLRDLGQEVHGEPPAADARRRASKNRVIRRRHLMRSRN